MAKFIHGMKPWYRLGWWIVRLHYIIWHRLKVIDIEKFPKTGGLIIAANHLSHLDPPAVGISSPRRAKFVAKYELWKSPFLKWYFRTIGVIPIKRGGGGSSTLSVAAEAIKNGDIVVFFPEGTRSRTGFPGSARTGIIILAAMTGAPVLPVRISGTYDCMPPGSSLPRPGPIQVAFGEPITWAQDELDPANREQMIREAQRVLEIIMALPGWLPKRAKKPEETSAEKTAPAPEQQN